MSDKKQQCEGWKRTGGAFSFGPVRWDQCENDATVTLTVKQKEESGCKWVKLKPLPSCTDCWNECIESKAIKVIEAVPITDK